MSRYQNIKLINLFCKIWIHGVVKASVILYSPEYQMRISFSFISLKVVCHVTILHKVKCVLQTYFPENGTIKGGFLVSGSIQYISYGMSFSKEIQNQSLGNIKNSVNNSLGIKCTMVTCNNNNKICFPHNLICTKLEHNVDHTTFISEYHPMWILAATKSKHCWQVHKQMLLLWMFSDHPNDLFVNHLLICFALIWRLIHLEKIKVIHFFTTEIHYIKTVRSHDRISWVGKKLVSKPPPTQHNRDAN